MDPALEQRSLTRRRWIKQLLAGGTTLAFGSLAYAWRVEPHWVDISRVDMPLRNLPSHLVGKRIVQLSDLHVGPVVDPTYLSGVLRRVPELEPDYVVITGDFLTSDRAEEVKPACRMLGESPIVEVPCFGVLGNHDYGNSFRRKEVAAQLTDRLNEIGVKVLRNESTEIDGLQIAGSDDLWAGRCNVYQSLESVDPERPTLYLAHNPDSADVAGWRLMQGWILSGHTHGGQCRFPLIGAPILPVRNQQYARGRVDLLDGRTLYVNRGLGYSRRLRFGVRPEVTVFTLKAA